MNHHLLTSFLVAVICFGKILDVQILALSAKPGSCANVSTPSQFNNTKHFKMYKNLQHICTWIGTHLDCVDDCKGRVHFSEGCLSKEDCVIVLCNVSEKDSGTYRLYVQLDPNSPELTPFKPETLSVPEEELKPTVQPPRNISHNATLNAGPSTPMLSPSSVFLVICGVLLVLVGCYFYWKRNKNKAGGGSSSSVEEQSYQNLLLKAGEGNTENKAGEGSSSSGEEQNNVNLLDNTVSVV